MTNYSTARTPSKRVTKANLRKHLVNFQHLLRQSPCFIDDYQLSIASSDYVRIANASGTLSQSKLAEDSLVVLLAGLSGLASLTGQARLNFLTRCVETATPEIAQQLKYLLHQTSDAVWAQAATVYEFALQVAHRQATDVYELLLTLLDQHIRKTMGSYFTPEELANQLTLRIEQSMIQDIGIADGFCDDAKRIHVLDPAAGPGVFLLSSLNAASRSTRFRQSFAEKFVQRLRAIELNPAIATICHCRVQHWLETRWENWPLIKLPIYCGDALKIFSQGHAKLEQSNVFLGNPPFNSLTPNTNEWISKLINGTHDGVSYYEIDGQPIRERKSWLHDDYIRFYRLAHFLIDRHGSGVIGFISNRAFIDNVTFRGMRWQLAKSFDKITVREYSTSEKEFAAWTNVAATVLTKATAPAKSSCQIQYTDSNSTTTIHPASPNYFFRPTRQISKRYLDSISLNDAFHTQGSAAITARDWFITDLNRDCLIRRVEEFCDLSIPDSEIRKRYFGRCRSRRYLAGDTRSWRLSTAREWLAGQDWYGSIRSCAYRPFDQRWILWLQEMIDWPRMHLMNCIDLPGNRCLVSRRQFPANQPACYFWVVNQPTIDGIVRSDNRGNERLFPLLRMDADGEVKNNLKEDFLDLVADCWSSFRIPDSTSLEVAVFHYLYGLFFSPKYREQHHEAISIDYPRIVLCQHEEETTRLIETGRELCNLHLSLDRLPEHPRRAGDSGTLKPRFHSNLRQIQIGDYRFDSVSVEDWQYRVGTHQVLRKWALDRKAVEWNPTIADQYRTIIQSIHQTRQLVSSLEDISFN